MGCTAEQSATTTTMARPDHTISMFEFGFGPSTLAAEAGSTSVLWLRNDGTLLHDWAILSTPITSETELRSDDVIASTRVEPGAVVILEFDTPPAGTYQIICTISGHFSEGMEGALVVTP
jgi:uncharacterized cupredoxin-like copper-binding protein